MNYSPKTLWQPSPADISASRLTQYNHWLKANRGKSFESYHDLWQWSVDAYEDFWVSLTDFFNVKFHTPAQRVISGNSMPDVHWFEGATLNYAEHIYKGMKDQKVALYFFAENGMERTMTVDEMWREVSRIQQYFIRQGVREGDRIAGYLPNIPEATCAFLAAVSLGAIWSCCSQDFGVNSVLDRFAQIEPVILVAADGYFYNGKVHSRRDEVRQIRQSISSIRDVLFIPYTNHQEGGPEDGITFLDALPKADADIPRFKPVEFSHPLWILYSSGTTGAPKAITHSHGGCLLEHLKYLAFHNDVHPGECFFWYTTTGWMMWNFLQGSMLHGASMVLYDGSPGYPSLDRLWEMASRLPIHHFGTSAPFLVACMKEGLHPGSTYDLRALRSIGSTGSPLPPEAFDWVYAAVRSGVWLCSMSGGTDVCTAFVGGVIEKPVLAGEIQARALGCALYAYDDHQKEVQGVVGEMVITRPMPSMPVFFWNDENMKKYSASYFEDIPGVWRHGDWVMVTESDGVIIFGRSDATLNRQGIRIGTAEIYRVLNEIPEIEDGLIVNLELNGGRHYMPLFVKMKGGLALTQDIIRRIVSSLKSQCSPRHVPDDVIQVEDIPYTISGKKMEAPVKKILLGMKVDDTLNKDAMRNPESLEFFKFFKVPEEKN